VRECQEMIKNVLPDYPDVRFVYSEAREAFSRAIFGEHNPPVSNMLSMELESVPGSDKKRLVIESSEPTFGPQPFLAIRTKAGNYHHDNLDFQEPFRRWTYLFHSDTFEWAEVDRVGVGSNDRHGFSHVVVKTSNEFMS